MSKIDYTDIEGAVIDLDGVITKTMFVHIRAWKDMFDWFLKRKSKETGEKYALMDIAKDYPPYIDGVSRNDGVRNFLNSRDIHIPEGNYDDPAGKGTIWGLGNLKYQKFLSIVDHDGVETYPAAVKKIKEWKEMGLRMAIISSSHTTKFVCEKIGIIEYFDVIIDGRVSYEMKLKGKPSPDVYLEAANRLELLPEDCFVVEDSILGVAGAKKGGFRYVIGVDRQNKADALLKFGADIVVETMDQLD
jgi:alpha,alpha-trehalase